ncbi:MAG: toll/interleukin-1 receptor domain-containing protein [Anaerolineae bacterium]|nr:toll/interleukin-1 receptor domain-containing protein [Anaerolineae bacterium]
MDKTMSSATKDYQVFLSYTASDREWVAAFRRSLQNLSLHHWFDISNVEPGERFSDTLEAALRQSDTLIVFISPSSVKSSAVLFEIGAAIAGKKRIIPVLIGDVGFGDLPEPLAKRQLLRANTPEEAGEQIARILEDDQPLVNGK